jgi:ribosome maturation factor RimP
MMYAESLLPRLREIARRAVEPDGLELAWLELKREGAQWILRVYIDRAEGGVGLTECERVSERLSVLLDVEDPIDSSYTLEVSSPGLDRPLWSERDYERFAGRLARVQLRQPLGARKRMRGRLLGVSAGSVRLEVEGEELAVPFSLIESGRLEVELFPGARKK